MSNQILTKAHKYLTEGSVKVQAHSAEIAVIEVQGSDWKPYVVTFAADWNCSCPARVECAHIVAAKLISPLRVRAHQSLGKDSKLDDWIATLPKPGIDDDPGDEQYLN